MRTSKGCRGCAIAPSQSALEPAQLAPAARGRSRLDGRARSRLVTHCLRGAPDGPQQRYSSLYLMAEYGDKGLAEFLKAGFRKAGKKLNMGKSCVRFRRADDLPLDVIGAVIARVPLPAFVARAQAARRR